MGKDSIVFLLLEAAKRPGRVTGDGEIVMEGLRVTLGGGNSSLNEVSIPTHIH